jgi:hypothetical protein
MRPEHPGLADDEFVGSCNALQTRLINQKCTIGPNGGSKCATLY